MTSRVFPNSQKNSLQTRSKSSKFENFERIESYDVSAKLWFFF